MAKQINTYDFLNQSHAAYNKYYNDWKLNANSYFGGVEYREGKYLKAYDIDYSTPSDVVNTYDVDANGTQTAVYSTVVNRTNSSQEANQGGDQVAGGFIHARSPPARGAPPGAPPPHRPAGRRSSPA